MSTPSGAAIEGGRWNDRDVPALYMALSPAISCLETFVHANGPPGVALKITCFELPDEDELYLRPAMDTLPRGWQTLPADRPSMDYGTDWLRSAGYLGLILPSAVLPLELNVMINPRHPGVSRIEVVDVFDFTYDPRMFARSAG